MYASLNNHQTNDTIKSGFGNRFCYREGSHSGHVKYVVWQSGLWYDILKGYMPRIKFIKKSLQIKFLKNVVNKLNLRWKDLAKALNVSERTLFDWRSCRYTLSQEIFEKCKKLAGEEVSIKEFRISAVVYNYSSRGRKKLSTVVVSGRAVVEYLLYLGLKIGSKVRQQIIIPKWISNDRELTISCLRGLIDTDGGVYFHKHRSGGHWYENIGIVFSNKSVPILKFVEKALEQTGFLPKINYRNDNIYLYRENDVICYAEKIKFHNDHHRERLKQYLERKNLWRVAPNGKARAWKARVPQGT